MILVPIIFLILGFCEIYIFSKKINERLGYRSKLASKNIENWTYAQILYGRILVVEAIIAIFVGLLILSIEAPLYSSSVSELYSVFCILIFIISSMFVERKLKEFDNR
ncbi:MAG: SdpI family protein [Sarcina sp.]